MLIPDPVQPPLTGHPFRPGFDDVSYPVLLEGSRILPRYPARARAARAQGTVILEAVVREDGTVGGIEVLRCSLPDLGFEMAAIKAVKRWRYRPGVQHGRPVTVYLTIVVDFNLE